MDFKLINILSEQENESDYDTAVDMSHWSMHKKTFSFETENNTIIEFTAIHESITHSYLEPDFDDEPDLPVGGYSKDNDGNSYPYKVHSDNSNDSYKSNYFLSVTKTNKIPKLTVEEVEFILRFKHDSYLDDDDLDNDTDNHIFLNINNDDMIKLENYLSEVKVQKLQTYNLPLPQNILAEIKNIDNLNKEQLQNNALTLKQNEIQKKTAQINIGHANLKDRDIINKELHDLIIYSKDSKETAQKAASLILDGANLNYENDIGDNALMIACRKNMKIVTTEMFNCFNSFNKDYLENTLEVNFHKTNNYNETLLMLSIKTNNNELVKKLINSNPDNLFVENKYNEDIITIASKFDNFEALKLIDEQINKHIAAGKIFPKTTKNTI